jgi:hypothetical protein
MNTKFYYKDGTVCDKRDLNKILHRADGPAIIYRNRSSKVIYHFVDGIYYTEEDFDLYKDLIKIIYE